MPAPAEPRPETDNASPPSARSDVDETAPASAPVGGAPSVLGFGPPAVANEVGTLGPYRLLKELGKGGMGAVYATLDTRLDRRLALKVMLPEFAADADAKGRFLREAKAAAKVKHDNVVTVYEADERNGVLYIAMEFLEGYPLNEYLKKKGNPTIPQVLRIGAEAASGLAAAHKIGLVHRDIKPANLWLEAPHGRVKVLDFGLARPVDAEVELTKSGAVVGTPAYMSPEQARGQKVDHRTDLFSLGSVLYRLCAGRLPFQGTTTMAVLMALGTEEPIPVRELNPDVPESLAALIHQLLSKRTDARPQSAEEVGRRLRALAQELAAPRARSAELSTSQPQVMQPHVVYVTMPVTAAPEANPFADLDTSSTETASPAAIEEPTAVRAKPRGLSPWLLAGGTLALAALMIAGVIIIKNKDGTETKIEVPDGATVTVKDGKTLAQVGPGAKNPAVDPDRKAAEWVIALGGSVIIDRREREIQALADLPKERFTLTNVNLVNTKVTDAELAYLKNCTNLKALDLFGTKVTDAGLAHLKDFQGLTWLRLSGTPVSDAQLEQLKGLKGLTYLDVRKTSVTAKGLETLHAMLPACRIEYDGGTIEPKVAADSDRKAAEWVIAQGGSVSVRVNGEADNRKAAAELPKERFTVTYTHLNGAKVSDGDLARFKGLKGLTWLDLSATPVSDAGLAHLKELKTLTHLSLANTKVTDAGLAHLKELKGLTHLDLSNTAVSDAGLEHLKNLKALAWLDVKKTKVTAKGLEALHEALPGCKIVHDGGTIEPKK